MRNIFTRQNVLRATFAMIMVGCLVILGLAGASLVGCATATVDVPACDTQTTNFGTAPALPSVGVSTMVTLPPVSVPFDISDALKKISDVADSEQVTVTGLTIDNSTGDLSWLRSVNATVTGSATDGSTPEAPFASGQWSGDPCPSLSLNVTMSGDQILHYLQSGQVTLNLTATGDVSAMSVPAGTQLTNSVTLCVDAQGTISKSL